MIDLVRVDEWPMTAEYELSRKRALKLRGKLATAEADRLRSAVASIRKFWRRSEAHIDQVLIGGFMRWTKAEKEFISSSRVARLATVDKKGFPSNVPICPLFVDGKFYVGTAANAKKVRNIKFDPHVALTFDEYTEEWARLRGVMVQGRAAIIHSERKDARRFRELRKKFYSKYPQYESSSPLSEGDSAIIEVNPEGKLSWGL